MKEVKYILSIVVIVIAAFSIGYFGEKQQRFDSCKSAYENLISNDLCIGKFEEFWGTANILGNVEYFDFNWDEDIGNYGEVKDYIGGVNRRCYNQAQRQFIETEKKKDLISCFADSIGIKDDILSIQCGCFFG